MEYKSCLVELDEVLNQLEIVNLEKIPLDIRKSIKENKDPQYMWKYDANKRLDEQGLDRKTIAMLEYLNITYLLNEDQKNVMRQIHNLNEIEQEKQKSDKYNSENIFKSKNPNEEEKTMTTQTKTLRWYRRVLGWIKNFFNK